ncbi:MAG: hypothetical protein HY366_01335 [Candidatus Aenigmarchaeota archaeon]|nr:hypothetical protein [Candidatus Aenigmarchaeota archaeon]
MLSVVIEQGRIVKIESSGSPVLHQLWGMHYEHALHAPGATGELKNAIERFEAAHPLEKASRMLRAYKEGVSHHVIETCSCHPVKVR